MHIYKFKTPDIHPVIKVGKTVLIVIQIKLNGKKGILLFEFSISHFKVFFLVQNFV